MEYNTRTPFVWHIWDESTDEAPAPHVGSRSFKTKAAAMEWRDGQGISDLQREFNTASAYLRLILYKVTGAGYQPLEDEQMRLLRRTDN